VIPRRKHWAKGTEVKKEAEKPESGPSQEQGPCQLQIRRGRGFNKSDTSGGGTEAVARSSRLLNISQKRSGFPVGLYRKKSGSIEINKLKKRTLRRNNGQITPG